MGANIFQLEFEGKPALGFDTGLDASAFAQAKMAQFITQPGFIVFPGKRFEEWKASGVIERRGPDGRASMVIWGPAFAGERLDLLIEDDARRDEALRAVCFWIETRLSLGDDDLSCRPGGVLASPGGAMLFPPERLTARCLQAEGDAVWLGKNESYIHPDLQGKDAASFTAAAMLYRIFSGTRPFSGDTGELLHQNIREGVFLPANLAAPGLDEQTAALINAALGGGEKGGGRPDPLMFRDCLAPATKAASTGGRAAFFHPLTETDQANINTEAARFWKKKNAAVHTRRFIIRNTALIVGAAIAIIAALLIAHSIAEGQASLPSTSGMDAIQVVHAYYDAFGILDHQMMEAAAIGKAGKGDIDMVTSFFVISRVRQAYEYTTPPVIPAQEWRDSGGLPSNAPVFGVSDLNITNISGNEAAGEIRCRVSYILWIPATPGEDGTGAPEAPPPDPAAPALPRGTSYTDDLTLIRHKGNWRISEINRR
jgi:hypothetical protein